MKIISILGLLMMIYGCGNSPSEFELCSGSLYPYYYPSLKYKGGFYTIKQHFYKNYIPVLDGNNSGIVRVRFHVNCKGEAGNYSTETYSLSYQSIELNSKIVNQLESLLKELQDWIPAIDDEREVVNSHKFLAFRIKDGELVEILPK